MLPDMTKETQHESTNTFLSLWQDETEKKIAEFLYSKTGIKADNLSIHLSVDGQSRAFIEKVNIELSDLTDEKKEEITTALTEILDESTVIDITENTE